MALMRLDRHLADPAPGFRCSPAGARNQSKQFIARIRHEIGKPASARALASAAELCGEARMTVRPFVELHDGAVLYRDKKSDAAGIRFFEVAEWELRTREMRESMIAMGVDENDMPEWFHQGIVFAEIPQSANYFVLQTMAPDTGCVFYCDHDGFEPEAMATSFEDLLSLIVNDPAAFLFQCGCYARYSDGKTPIQWCPEEYLADCGNE